MKPSGNATVPLHRPDEPDLDRRIAAEVRSEVVSACSDVIDPARLERLRALVDLALHADEQRRRPDDLENLGRVTFLPVHGREALSLLEDERVIGPCDEILGADCTLYTMTTLCVPPKAGGRPVHLDLHYRPPGYMIGLGAMVLLDDFEPDAGPTRFYPDITEEQPADADFEARSLELIAPAGSVCWFDGGAWHDVLPNRSEQWRRAILLAMIRPWVRQRFDMARLLAHLDPLTFSDQLVQKLGFLHIAPASMDEFDLPDEVRKRELLRRAVERP